MHFKKLFTQGAVARLVIFILFFPNIFYLKHANINIILLLSHYYSIIYINLHYFAMVLNNKFLYKFVHFCHSLIMHDKRDACVGSKQLHFSIAKSGILKSVIVLFTKTYKYFLSLFC